MFLLRRTDVLGGRRLNLSATFQCVPKMSFHWWCFLVKNLRVSQFALRHLLLPACWARKFTEYLWYLIQLVDTVTSRNYQVNPAGFLHGLYFVLPAFAVGLHSCYATKSERFVFVQVGNILSSVSWENIEKAKKRKCCSCGCPVQCTVLIGLKLVFLAKRSPLSPCHRTPLAQKTGNCFVLPSSLCCSPHTRYYSGQVKQHLINSQGSGPENVGNRSGVRNATLGRKLWEPLIARRLGSNEDTWPFPPPSAQGSSPVDPHYGQLQVSVFFWAKESRLIVPISLHWPLADGTCFAINTYPDSEATDCLRVNSRSSGDFFLPIHDV